MCAGMYMYTFYNCESHCIRDYIDIKYRLKKFDIALYIFTFVINHRSSVVTLLQILVAAEPSSKFLTHIKTNVILLSCT